MNIPKRLLWPYESFWGEYKMNHIFKAFLGLVVLTVSTSLAMAECMVTTKNFSKTSRIIYVAPHNGSDQLSETYTYNLGNVANPYTPRNIVAFQSIEQALAVRDVSSGDLLLIKTGDGWSNYEAYSQNKLSDFNKQRATIYSYSQEQCRGENLTWINSPAAAAPIQNVVNTTVTQPSNNNELTVATSEAFYLSQRYNNLSSRQPSPSQTTRTYERNSGSSSSGSSSSSNTTSNNTATSDESKAAAFRERVQHYRDLIAAGAPVTQQVANVIPNVPKVTKVVDSDPVQNDSEKVNDNFVSQCTANASWESSIYTYPQDKNGWSIIEPDSETRIVYVSTSDGNDNYARPYKHGEVSDEFNPESVNAYKTIEKAYQQLRDGKPDWLLLKKGDTFELQDSLWLKSGKSLTAHMVVGSYGDKDSKRPVIESPVSVFRGTKKRNYITLVGIEFYASARDPESEKFPGWGKVKGASGFSYVAGGDVEGFHIENNRFNYFGGAIGLAPNGDMFISNVVIRRNQILNAYNDSGHSSGIFLGGIKGALIEENLIDHNGWYQQRPKSVPLNTKSNGYATFFNHNVYIDGSSNLVIRKNLSSRSSSIGMKFTSNSSSKNKIDTINSSNILLDNNLIVEGEIGFSIGGNIDLNTGYRWDGIHVINNVLSNIGRTRPTNRNIAFNIEANDWKSGTICGNAMVDRDDKSLNNAYAISTNGHVGDIIISENNVVNLGIEAESYSANEKTITKNNQYIPMIEKVNFLNSYVNSKGYSNYNAYITGVINAIKEDSSAYYDVTEPLNYIQSRAR